MLVVVFTLAFDWCCRAVNPTLWIPAYAGMTVLVGWCCLVVCLALWIPAYAGMTVWWDCLAVTLAFDSSPIKGEGDNGGWLYWTCSPESRAVPLGCGQVRNDGAGCTPPCGYCLEASMTVLVGVVLLSARPLTSGLRIKSAMTVGEWE